MLPAAKGFARDPWQAFPQRPLGAAESLQWRRNWAISPARGSRSFLLPSQAGVHFECCGKPRPCRPYEGERGGRKGQREGGKGLWPSSTRLCPSPPAAMAADPRPVGPARHAALITPVGDLGPSALGPGTGVSSHLGSPPKRRGVRVPDPCLCGAPPARPGDPDT